MINVIFNEFDGVDLVPRLKETFEKYCQILQWGRRHPTRFIEDFFNMELLDHQKWILMSSWCPANTVWVCSRSSGKAQVLDTKVYVATKDRGDERFPSKTIGDLKVGDRIYGADGKLTTVIHLNPIVFEEVYEVEFEDGEIIKCNGEHLWAVYDAERKKNRGTRNTNLDYFVVRNTDFIYTHFNRSKQEGKHDSRFSIPMTKPVEYGNNSRLPIHPYLLGAWLGDGTSSRGEITSSGDDVWEMNEIIKQYCHTTKVKKDEKKDNCYRIHVDRQKEIDEAIEQGIFKKCQKIKPLVHKLKELGVFDNKHIPDKYLYSTVENRIALVSGLMDTDGYIDETGHCEFTQVNKVLFDQFCQLLGSLGIDYTATPKDTGYIRKDGTESRCWRCYFTTSKELPVFKLKRKYDKLPDHPLKRTDKKFIVDVRKTGRIEPMRCITVSNDDGLYLCGEHYTVTHNSFLVSPFMMARALLFPRTNTYILGPTGSQAQETFTKMENVAKNNIASVIGVSSVFLDECVRQNAKADPFTHDKNSFHVELYNGSTVNTLNSVAKNIVGIRSHMP